MPTVELLRSYARWRDAIGWGTRRTFTRSPTQSSPSESKWRMRRRVRSENARNIKFTCVPGMAQYIRLHDCNARKNSNLRDFS